MHTTVKRRFRLRIKRRAPSTRIRIVDGRAWARNAAYSATTQDAHQRSFGTIGILAAARIFDWLARDERTSISFDLPSPRLRQTD